MEKKIQELRSLKFQIEAAEKEQKARARLKEWDELTSTMVKFCKEFNVTFRCSQRDVTSTPNTCIAGLNETNKMRLSSGHIVPSEDYVNDVKKEFNTFIDDMIANYRKRLASLS